MRVVICGAGVIGACTAYFLSRRKNVDVTIVEGTAVAAAASGKAGGFLALDWCAGTPLDPLARRSFELHAALAAELAGDWGYRGMTAFSGIVVGDFDARRREKSRLNWLSEGVLIASRLSTPDTTAIVHPFKFTSGILQAAQACGAKLRNGRVTGILRNAHDTAACGVEVDGNVLEADAVVIAMGPWSLLAAEWTSMPAVYGRRSPSIVYDTGSDVPPHALFLEYAEPSAGVVSVEVFPRADGSTHITALSEMAPLPVDPATVRPEADEVERLQAIAERLSPTFRTERIISRQACFRPVTQDGLPLIGKSPRSEGIYVATGHNVWGILNAPATGAALAELVTEGSARTVDLAPFDPTRLPVMDPSMLRRT